MTNVTASAVDAGSAISSRGVSRNLTGNMGALGLTFTVMAFAAPMAVVKGYLPLGIMFGGPGASFGVILTVAILLLFSVGYVTMTKSLPVSGNFYAFISAGLGKSVGLGSAFLAVFGYICFLCGTYVFLGVTVESLVAGLGGPALHWSVWTFLGWFVVSSLGYFNIELSAKILTVAMVIEVLIVMVFNVFVLAQGGAEGLSLTPLTVSAFSEGDMGVTLLYLILIFMGFEVTAIFRDEVRDPDRTIPRATYGAVLFIGLLYVLSCYSLVSAYGATAWEVAKEDPSGMFANAMGRFVSPLFTQIAYFSVIMSVFAALLAIHNVLARYVLNLAKDRVLSRSLARVHRSHNSPHVASNAITLISGATLALLVYGGVAGESLYGIITGVGGLCVIFLMALVSFAVINWFRRDGLYKRNSIFKVFVAPAVAAVTFLATFFFAVKHLDHVVGGAPGENNWVLWMMIGAFILGWILAVFFRFKRPSIYSGLGRAEQLIN